MLSAIPTNSTTASSQHSSELAQYFPASPLPSDELTKNFNWLQSRYESIDLITLIVIRYSFLALLMAMLATELAWEDFIWFLIYETFWSFLGTTAMVLSTLKGMDRERNESWYKFACYSSEIGFGFNSMATILFWIVLAPELFANTNWHDFFSAWACIRMIMLHSVPMLASIVDLVVSDVTFIDSHWKYVFATGCAYIVANYFGTIYMKTPLYPVVDWKNPAMTIFLFVIQAACMALMFLAGAWLSRKLKRRH